MKKKNIKIPRPSKSQVELYLKAWDSLKDYPLQESSLRKLFIKTYPVNTDLDDVLVKVCALNEFYRAGIFKIVDLAKHIRSLNIDDDLKNNNLDLVEKIASGHGIRKNKNAKESYLYSFATKYCSHHNPETYPIYDSYVEKVLIHFQHKDGFYRPAKQDLGLFKSKIRLFKSFRDIILGFRKYYELESFNLKQIDQYLWLLGKKYFQKQHKKTKP